MASQSATRVPTDADLDAYSNYIAKLAAVASPGDPPVTPFRLWFFWRYNAFPSTALVHDRSLQAA